MKEVLTLDVRITDTFRVEGTDSSAQMVMFEASCDCENFKGKTMPGAVDTQRLLPENILSLSARYILEGVDRDGNDCRIFIENNGQAPLGAQMKTSPRVITDSKALAFLEKEELAGLVEPSADGVIIHIMVCA